MRTSVTRGPVDSTGAPPTQAGLRTAPRDTRSGRGRLRTVLRRWPTLLGVGSAIVVLDGAGVEDSAGGFGELLLLLPLVYLVVAALQRRRAAWPVLGVGFVTLVLLGLQDVVAPATALVAIGAAVLAVSVLGHRHHADSFRAQVVGLVAFSALALVGLADAPELGRYVIGIGWLLHGVWDLVHLRRDAVVARSYAEWCGVLDTFVGTYLILG